MQRLKVKCSPTTGIKWSKRSGLSWPHSQSESKSDPLVNLHIRAKTKCGLVRVWGFFFFFCFFFFWGGGGRVNGRPAKHTYSRATAPQTHRAPHACLPVRLHHRMRQRCGNVQLCVQHNPWSSQCVVASNGVNCEAASRSLHNLTPSPHTVCTSGHSRGLAPSSKKTATFTCPDLVWSRGRGWATGGFLF